MVQVTQTEEEIKIIIELNSFIKRKPDIVLLPTYIKFNSPPIFFERHLAQEVDEDASFCRIIRREARIVLIKKEKGIWPDLFLTLSKEELQKRRSEITDKLIEQNQERDKQKAELYEQKRKNEIEKEIQRETAIRQRQEEYKETACRKVVMVDVRKDTKTKEQTESKDPIATSSSSRNLPRLGTPTPRPAAMIPLRNCGSINFSYSSFNTSKPKRESQMVESEPFKVEPKFPPQNANTTSEPLDTVDE